MNRVCQHAVPNATRLLTYKKVCPPASYRAQVLGSRAYWCVVLDDLLVFNPLLVQRTKIGIFFAQSASESDWRGMADNEEQEGQRQKSFADGRGSACCYR